MNDGKDVSDFLPFLDDDDIKKLAFAEFERGGIAAVEDYLPFMDEDDVRELAEKVLKK